MAPKQKITIIFFEMKCWKCGTLQYCYTVEPSLKSVCNCDFDVEQSSWDDHNIDKHLGVYAAVQDFLQTEEGRQLKVGPVKNGIAGRLPTVTYRMVVIIVTLFSVISIL